MVARHHALRLSAGGWHAISASMPDSGEGVFPNQVERTDVGLRQAGWPEGAIPFTGILVAPLTTPIHICEGEKDTDALRKLGFVATTNSEGAANWTDNLNEHFQDRTVFVHEDNDDDGRKRCQRIARALDPITKSVRIIRLPGLKEHGDVSDWLEGDPSGARLVKHCESAPVWEPTAEPPLEEDKASEDDDNTETTAAGFS